MNLENTLGLIFIFFVSSLVFLLTNYDNKIGRPLLNPLVLGMPKRVFKDKEPLEYNILLWSYRVLSLLGFVSGLYLLAKYL